MESTWLTPTELALMLGVTPSEVIRHLSTMGLIAEGSAPSPIALDHGLADDVSDYATSSTLWHSDVIELLGWTGLVVREPEESAETAPLFEDDSPVGVALNRARAAAKRAPSEPPATGEPTARTARGLGGPFPGFDQVIATDGACSGNPGPGGWAWVDQLTGAEGSGGSPATTNNIMELTAMLEALRHADPAASLLIRSDSQYVINVVTTWAPSWRAKGWRKADGKPVKNRELIEELLAAYEARTARTKVDWVRGHDGDEGNERADRLAVSERDRYASR